MRNTQPKIGGPSPWGQIDNMDVIADGIVFVGTAGHGGIWLSQERIEQIPVNLRQPSSAYAQKPIWWEEDCEAGFPLWFFGALIKREDHNRRPHRGDLVKMLDYFGKSWIDAFLDLKITPVCAACMSRDITSDSVSRWNDATQMWEQCGTLDNTDCQKCNDECHTFEVPSIAPINPVDDETHVRFDPRTGEKVVYQDAADASEHRLRLMEDGYTGLESSDEG